MAISIANLLVNVGADVGQAVAGLKTVSSSLGNVVDIAAGFSLGQAFTNAPRVFLDMAKGAAEDAASVARVQQAIENTAGGWAQYGRQVDEAIARGRELAFSGDQTRAALARLSTTQDLARGAGLDLAGAARLLGKVTDDNVTVLARYGIQVDKTATAQDLLNAVDAKFGGQAGTFAASGAGDFARASDAVSELREALGAALLPAIGAATAAVGGFTTALGVIASTGVGAETFRLMAAALGGVLALAFGASAVAAGKAAVAFIGLDTAALPWIALAAGIGAAVYLRQSGWVVSP